MSDLDIRDDAIWKRPVVVSVKDAGVWKPVKTVYEKDAGVWKPVWTAPGAQVITGSTTFTVPAHVWSICVAGISPGEHGTAGNASSGGTVPGAGGKGGDGGSLAWKNNIAVTPGQTYTVTISGNIAFGTLTIAEGRGGVSAGWDNHYLGGIGGAGMAVPEVGPFGNLGFPGGAAGSAATWVGAGADGHNAPDAGNPYGYSMGGSEVDLLGVIRTTQTSLAGGLLNAGAGGAGGNYGGGGGGGSGGDKTGTTAGRAGGNNGVGAFRVIWGTGKSFPNNANF